MINRLVCIRQSNDVNGKLDEAKRLWNDEKRLKKKKERFWRQKNIIVMNEMNIYT